MNAEVYWAPLTAPVVQSVTDDGKRFTLAEEFRFAGDVFDLTTGRAFLNAYIQMVSASRLELPEQERIQVLLKSYKDGVHQVDYFPEALMVRVDWNEDENRYEVVGYKSLELNTPHRVFMFGPGFHQGLVST